MNKNSERNQTVQVPLTPNLDHLKLHGGRGKTKKKSAISTMQPTQPPFSHNPMQKSPSNAHLKQNYCALHPNNKVMQGVHDGALRSGCVLCALTDGNNKKAQAEEKNYKTRSMDEFKKRISNLKETINARQFQVQGLLFEEDDKQGEYVAYMSEVFHAIIRDIDEKHKQLNNLLCESISKRKRALEDTNKVMQEMTMSIERYLYDINVNYEQILAELSLSNFKEIMDQYNAKIEYYNQNVLKKINQQLSSFDQSINVYLPFEELRRVLGKANVHYLGAEMGRIASNRSLDKYMSSDSQKEQRAVQNGGKKEKVYFDAQARQDRKSESKPHPRKRGEHNRIHLIRGANKENSFLNDYYNCEEEQ